MPTLATLTTTGATYNLTVAPKTTNSPRAIRLTLSPFTAAQMRWIADRVLVSVRSRINRGINAQDQPAKALTRNYAKRKILAGLPDLRDWYYQGRLSVMRRRGKGGQLVMRRAGKDGVSPGPRYITDHTLINMQVVTATANRAVIGFPDGLANLIAYVNNNRMTKRGFMGERAFAVSPRDYAVLRDAVEQQLEAVIGELVKVQ